MHHTLIVARMKPDAAPAIAEAFAASDRTDLPHLIGVTHRRLFHFDRDLYLHLITSHHDPAPTIARTTDHPEFRAISARLAPHVTAYNPATWRTPQDAMAHCFYQWDNPTP
ncbi:TcmI family type II polyketide cyclase [Streptomyces macrosporus]|uniref:TcmI family type II polyketide cyclase n=1 Tax=Streptomyces macrosporus TaxID=44032 RepID=A0ABP5WM93_9ACTN